MIKTRDDLQDCLDKDVISGGGQAFRGSKYVQSDLKDCFTEIKKHIEKKTVVCFIGTPCQVYGLKSFLGKEYDNLVTVDVVCHGTPSPKMWEKYLNLQKSKYHSEIESVAFRYKTYGYHSSTMRIAFKNGKSYFGSARVDLMLKSFFEGLSSRPSCYKCHFKTLERCSDFTIYDCWNAEKLVNNLIDDDKGFTNLIVQSSKGEKILEEIKDKYELYSVDLKKAADLDGVMIWNSAQPHPRRNEFYHGIDEELLDNHVQKFAPIKVKDYLIEYEWHIRLVLEGEDRIFMNYEIIQGKWMPSREDREYKEEILEGVDEAVSTLERMISEERVEELLATLTDLQRKVVHIHLFHGLSFTEAAKHLGMTRQNLTGIYNAAIYKIQKKHFRALCS